MKWFNIFSDHLWSGPAAQFDQREARPGEGAEEGDVQVGNNILLKDYYNYFILLGSPATAAIDWWASTEFTAPGGAGTSTHRPCVQVRKKKQKKSQQKQRDNYKSLIASQVYK